LSESTYALRVSYGVTVKETLGVVSCVQNTFGYSSYEVSCAEYFWKL